MHLQPIAAEHEDAASPQLRAAGEPAEEPTRVDTIGIRALDGVGALPHADEATEGDGRAHLARRPPVRAQFGGADEPWRLGGVHAAMVDRPGLGVAASAAICGRREFRQPGEGASDRRCVSTPWGFDARAPDWRLGGGRPWNRNRRRGEVSPGAPQAGVITSATELATRRLLSRTMRYAAPYFFSSAASSAARVSGLSSTTAVASTLSAPSATLPRMSQVVRVTRGVCAMRFTLPDSAP